MTEQMSSVVYNGGLTVGMWGSTGFTGSLFSAGDGSDDLQGSDGSGAPRCKCCEADRQTAGPTCCHPERRA